MEGNRRERNSELRQTGARRVQRNQLPTVRSPEPVEEARDTERLALVRGLQDCALVCENGADQALGAAKTSAAVDQCRDAAQLCALLAKLMARQSDAAAWLMPVVELACERAARACERRESSVFVLADCAWQCRRVQHALDRASLRRHFIGTYENGGLSAQPEGRLPAHD